MLGLTFLCCNAVVKSVQGMQGKASAKGEPGQARPPSLQPTCSSGFLCLEQVCTEIKPRESIVAAAHQAMRNTLEQTGSHLRDIRTVEMLRHF